jgi:hypothetical protein
VCGLEDKARGNKGLDRTGHCIPLEGLWILLSGTGSQWDQSTRVTQFDACLKPSLIAVLRMVWIWE